MESSNSGPSFVDTQHIKSEKQAHDIWERYKLDFESRIDDAALASKPESAKTSRRNHFFTPAEEEYLQTLDPEKRKKAYDLGQRSYERAVKKASTEMEKLVRDIVTIKVNPEGDHSLELNLLLNDQTSVKKRFRKKDLEDFATLLEEKPYSEEFFREDTPYLLMGLAAQGKISPMQLSSYLEIHQSYVRGELKDFKAYRILDGNKQFTPEAEKFLLPAIRNSRIYSQLNNPDEKESFRLLIAELPESERWFFASDLQAFKEYCYVPERGSTDTFNLVIGNNVMLSDLSEDQKKVVARGESKESFAGQSFFPLTNGAKAALNLVNFGYKNYVRSFGSFGMFTPSKIKEGVFELHSRFAVLRFPDIKPYKDIHEMTDLTDVLARAHDDYHAMVMATIGYDFMQIFKRFIDVVDEQTGIEMSREIWEWIDAEFTYFFTHGSYNTAQSSDDDFTQRWCDFIEGMMNIGLPFKRGASITLQKDFKIELTPVGIMIFLDMVKNPDEWKDELHIDASQLSEQFSYFYKHIKSLSKAIANDSSEIKVLKLQIYLHLLRDYSPQMAQQKLSELHAIIHANYEDISDRIEFSKILRPKDRVIDYQEYNSPPDPDNVPNRIFLFFDGEPINSKTIDSVIEQIQNYNPNLGLTR